MGFMFKSPQMEKPREELESAKKARKEREAALKSEAEELARRKKEEEEARRAGKRGYRALLSSRGEEGYKTDTLG
tara:strand:+ start:47 stop:271 length:225 start_codon:yes stop_codon:yes gene_type:complete